MEDSFLTGQTISRDAELCGIGVVMKGSGDGADPHQGRAVRFICRFLHPHKMSSVILRKDFSMDIQLGRLDGTLQIIYIWLSLWKLVDTNEDLSQIDCSSRNSLLTPTPFLWSLRYS